MAVVYDILSGTTIDYRAPVGVSVDYTPGLIIGAGPSDDDDALEFAFAPPPGSPPGAEGVFTFPYADSTREGPSHFTLRRKGGMPEGWRYRVFEAPVVPDGGQGWGLIYGVDLTAHGSNALSASGAYAIDGKTWWVKGALTGTAANALVSGAGLRLFQPDSIDLGSRAWWGGNTLNTYLARVNVFPLAQLADFNPDAPLAVTWRATGPTDGNNARCIVMALCDVTLDANALTGGDKATALTLNQFGDAGAYGQWDVPPYDNFTATLLSTSYAGTSLADYESGIFRFLPGRYWPLIKQWGGTPADPDTMLAAAPSGGAQVHRPHTALSTSPCILFALQKPSSGGGTALNVHLTHLNIWQPKVAA